MEEEKQDVVEESSTSLESVIEESETSPQQATDTQQATAQQAEVEAEETTEPIEEEARIPYSRFKEKVDETNWLREQMNQRNQQVQQPATQPEQPLGNTPEEREFWRQVDKRAELKAAEKMKELNPVIDSGLQEIAAMKVQNFRKSYPDIKADSPDELAIAGKIRQGYLPDDAYWAVMGPRGVQKAEQRAVKKVKNTVQQKRQANMESSPSVSPGVQAKEAPSFEETFEKEYRKAGGE